MKRIAICTIIVGLIIVVGVLVFTGLPTSLFQPNGPTLGYLSDARVPQKSFSTLETFASTQTAGTKDRHKVIFVGIDGAAWNIIDPMIDEGSLPTFARLKREGCCGILRSTKCYVSPPAWSTMMTGRIPERTGIYTFGHWHRQHKRFLPVQSTDITVRSVWDIASDAQRRTGIINVPMTYPVNPVNGILISGLMTPTQLGDRHTSPLQFRESPRPAVNDPAYPTFSPELSATVVFSGGRFQFQLLDTIDDHQPKYDRVRLILEPEYGKGGGAPGKTTHVFPVNVFSPWLKFDYSVGEKSEKAWCKVRVVQTGRDDVPWVAGFSRVLFSAGDTDAAFTYPDSIARVLQREFGYYFPSKFLDRAIVPEYTRDSAGWASFLQQYDDWDLYCYVFTQSDNIQHLDGVSPATRAVYQTIDTYLARIISELPRNGTLIIASDHGFKEHTYAFDLNKLFEQINLLAYKQGDGSAAATEIDHGNTLVFHNMWCLYFNRSLLTGTELQKRGVPVTPGESPREALISYLREAGGTLTVGENRVPFPIKFTPVSQDAVGYAPDMVVDGSYDTYLVEFWNLKRPQKSIVRRLRPDEQWNHTRDGIYMFYGDGIKKGVGGSTGDIQDITPTMLYLLGVPVAADLEGRVMTQVFDTDMLAARTCYVVESYGEARRMTSAGDEERESLEKKLRSLGYIHE